MPFDYLEDGNKIGTVEQGLCRRLRLMFRLRVFLCMIRRNIGKIIAIGIVLSIVTGVVYHEATFDTYQICDNASCKLLPREEWKCGKVFPVIGSSYECIGRKNPTKYLRFHFATVREIRASDYSGF